MENPIVTIILFAHAPYAKFLPTSLESILRQSYPDLEVLVLGDGSNEIRKIVERFVDDRRVSLVAQTRSYFLETANELMTSCKGVYVGTWNSDDLYNEEHVALLVRALENDLEAGGAFDNTQYFKEFTQDAFAKQGEENGGLIVPEQLAQKLAYSRLSVEHIFNENIMTGPSSIIRRSAFERVGGYDGKIRLNCDLHWFYRIASYFPIRFVNYVGVRKRIHPLNNTAVHPHYEFGVRELEDIRLCYPDVYLRIGKKVFDKKLGRKYFRLALFYEKQGQIVEARKMYRKAMALRKFSLRYHWEYVRSTLLSCTREVARD